MNAKGKMQAQLSAYLDGELDEARLRQVEEALENDGDLRAELADLAAARKLLRDLPAEKPPADLVSRVLAEAERSRLVGGQHAESGPSPLRWIRYAASAAVLLVAAAVGMVIAITLCSPGMYKDNLARREVPAGNVRSNETDVAAAGGKRKGQDEDLDRDRERLGRIATGDLPADGTRYDDREPEGRHGVAGAGGHGLDGKLSTMDDNVRSLSPGPGSPAVPGGMYDNGNGTTTIAGTRSKIGDGNLLTSNGDGSLTLGDGGTGGFSGSNTYAGNATINSGTLAKNSGGTLDVGVISGRGGASDLSLDSLDVAAKGGAGRGGDYWNGAMSKGYGDNNDDAVSGPFNNVKNMSRVLAGDMTNNTIIYTDRLDQAQWQVETVLNANGIAPVVTRQSESAGAANKTGSQAPQARGNFYVANTLSPAQVQYEAYVTPEQMAKVQKALDSVRARQNVSQDVPALAYNGASVRDGGWGYNQDQAGKYGHFTRAGEKPNETERAGKDSNDTERAGIAIAGVDGYRSYQRKAEAPSETPLAKAARPGGSAGRAPEPAPPAETGLAARPATIPRYDTPAAKNALPAPVVVAPDRTRGEVAREKAKQDVQTLARGEPQPAEGAAKKESTPAEKPAGDTTQLGSASTGDRAPRNQTHADEAQPAKAPASGSGLAAASRGQSANELLVTDVETRRQVAQTRPATTGEKIAVAESPVVRAPSAAAKAESTPPPNQAAKTGDLLAESDVRFSTRPAGQRPAGQAAGPVGGQRAEGLFNPPTTAPAPATATMKQQEQIVQVGLVRQAPLTQSGGTVVVLIANQPGRSGWLEEEQATARVQRLVITLNYREPGEAGRMLDRARLSAAAASQLTPQTAPAANVAAQEEIKTQSK